MEKLSKEQIEEKKKTWKGKLELYKLGKDKFKRDPPIYRIHMMQGLMVKLTIYMIIFACIYATSIGLWVFALILFPVGVIGNYYSMKSHLIKYKDTLKTYELAGMIPPIEDDISNLRRRWRIIERQIGFLGVDIIYLTFTIALSVIYFSGLSLTEKIYWAMATIPVLCILYFNIIYNICNHYYKRGTN